MCPRPHTPGDHLSTVAGSPSLGPPAPLRRRYRAPIQRVPRPSARRSWPAQRLRICNQPLAQPLSGWAPSAQSLTPGDLPKGLLRRTLRGAAGRRLLPWPRGGGAGASTSPAAAPALGRQTAPQPPRVILPDVAQPAIRRNHLQQLGHGRGDHRSWATAPKTML